MPATRRVSKLTRTNTTLVMRNRLTLSYAVVVPLLPLGMLLTGERLAPLVDAVRIARRARRILHANLAWAAAYNLAAIAFAASGAIAPGWAALGMAGSSLGVTLNALRVGRIGAGA